MQPGDVIADRFEVETAVGAGGVGVVYRAHDRATGDVVAVKVLQSDSDTALARFEREAQNLAAVEHSGVVRYVAHGVTADDQPFLAMEWIDGESLATRLARGPLGLEQTLMLLEQAAAAVGSLHARGLVHRDVTPGNIMLVGAGERVKLLDLGLTRVPSPLERLTQPGAPIGTPAFMAPEQARGAAEVDARADVFSLGCVAFACLTGTSPFDAVQPLAAIIKVVVQPAPRLAQLAPVPLALDELCARMLAKDPADRPGSGLAVAEELARIAAGRPAPAPSPKSALSPEEQRLVTVVVASPAIVGSLDDATAPMLDLHATAEALRHGEAAGARLETLADGALVAMFSAEGTAIDQTARAARCALGIHRALPWAPIAIATMRGVIGDGASIGEMVERAAHLVAPGAGHIYLDAVTAGLLEGRFVVADDGGEHRLVGEGPIGGVKRSLLGRPTRCVGRDRELATLWAYFNDSAGAPRARAVLLVGAAGAGKSRVRHEFVQRLAMDRGGVTVLTARGDSVSAGAHFGMLSQLVRDAVGLHMGEAPASVQAKLTARAGTRQVAELIGELCGAAFSDEGSPRLRAAREDSAVFVDLLRDAWLELVAAECARRPTVLVLEDLHWGDASTVAFVEAALARLAERPLFVLSAARPEVREVFPRLWPEQLHEVRIGALSARARTSLVRQVFGAEVPGALVERMVEQSGGNALFLEEIIRSVAEGRGETLPETVLAMLQARLDTLAVEARSVLRAASIFGPCFWRGAVATLLGGRAPSDLDACLAELAERELVVARASSRFPGEREYVFRNDLMREAAYALLTEEDRALGHRLAGEWLREAGEAQAIVIAQHFERGGDAHAAAAQFLSAAEQALHAHDCAAAGACAERALQAEAPVLRGRARLVQAEANNWSGEFAAAERCAAEALTLLPPGTPPWCRAAAELADAAGRLGKVERLHLLGDDLLSHDDLASAPYLVACARAVGQLRLNGVPEVELGALSTRVDQVGARQAEPLALAWLCRVRALVGDLARSAADHQESARLFELAGNRRYAVVELSNAADSWRVVGAYAKAAAALDDCWRRATALGLTPIFEALLNGARAPIAFAQGDLEEASRLVQAALSFRPALENPRHAVAFHTCHARVRLALGDPAAAEVAARAALTAANHPQLRAFALGALAEAQLERTPAAALATAREGLALAAVHAVEYGDGLLRLCEAAALLALGDRAGAAASLATAAARLETSAACIGDPEARASYLDAVPEHARIRALCAAL